MGRMMEFILVSAMLAVMTGCMAESTNNGSVPSGNTSQTASTASPSASPVPSTTAAPTLTPTPSTKAPFTTPSTTPTSTASPAPSVKPGPTSFANEAAAKKTIEKRTKETIEVLKQQDMTKLAELIHPKKGVQFSPYSHINVTSDVQVSGSGLAALWTNTSTTHWGNYDGSGDSIDLTFPDYWDKFVYNQNFAAAPQVSYNLILGKGNMINNVFSVYPTASFITVEYHFHSIDPQFDGMDWTSLRLVYENSGSQWYLVAIVHDQHTM